MSSQIRFLKLRPEAQIPTRSHPSDAGMDLYSLEDAVLKPGEKVVLSTGLAAEFPKGYFISIRDRAGLAAKHGLHSLAGVVDCHYRGEWKVVLVNLGKEEYKVTSGDRIAQAILHKIPEVEVLEVEKLSHSDRGEGGFGSTGK